MTAASMQCSTTRDATRRLGQVFTPRSVADWMAVWVCQGSPERILDPAVGEGVFVDAVESQLRGGARWAPRVDVCEIDATLLRRFAASRRRLCIRRRRADFITAGFRTRYDAIIANPPYVRHHAMEYDAATLARFDRICRRRLSRMTNLYGLFLIKIWTLLAEGGRAAIITPAEWLNADFGVPIKAYLLEENAIDAIVHFDHTATVFEGTLTTAAITLLRRGRRADAPVGLLTALGIEHLKTMTLDQGRRVAPADLDPGAKWTPLFANHSLKTPSGPVLGDVARCSRGIATGANDYFALRESERRRWRIDLRDLRFCITKARQAASDTFTRADARRLAEADERVYLLHPRPRLTAAVRRYLEEGRRRGVHERYLPSHRPVWYVPEHREPAPILVSVFSRGVSRFVLNKAGVLNLTAYHAIYLRAPSRSRIRALFAYLNSPEAQRSLQPHRRIYADGLIKLEPRDVEALTIPKDVFRLCRPGESGRTCHRD